MSFGRRAHLAGWVDALDPERGSVLARRRILQVTPDGYLAGMRLPANAVWPRHGPVTAVIGVAHGGLTPAHSGRRPRDMRRATAGRPACDRHGSSRRDRLDTFLIVPIDNK
jgi:hypothetical protein